MSLSRFVSLLALAVPFTVAHAVEIDGRIDPAEWQDGHHVTDFRKIQPLTGDPGSLPTEAWILATPDGLAIAFRATHPAGVPRTRQKVQRDFSEQVDRVNAFIDFDGDGRTGYAFTVSSTGGIADEVITNENQFSNDWDGQWRHAVSEDEQGWSVELLIPWHTAPMRDGVDGQRTLKVFLARVIGATGERMAWPAASFERPRFLSDFAPITVPKHDQSLLAITPYLSGLYDNVGGRGDFNAGADVFWKPNGRFQLTATVKPDFGQVEADDLVVNFSATETFISDKRPFFTENQGIFELTTPSDDSQQLYTRRVGSTGDITAAVKLNGSLGKVNYGLFSADEDGATGRSYRALRVVRDFDTQNLGAMLTRVDDPWRARDATVLGMDHNWRPTARWNVRTRLLGSRIAQAGNEVDDVGATVWADYEMDDGWRQQWIAMHFGNDLQLNDFGYLSRNSTNYLHWEVRKRFTALPEDSRYSSKDWRGRVSSSYNNRGDKLNDQFRVSREGQLRNGSYEYAQINVNSAGINDMLLRGNGIVRMPANFNTYLQYERPRKGDWAHEAEAEAFTGGLAGNRRLGAGAGYTGTYFINDAFSLYGGFYALYTPDWLVWQREDLVGGFQRRQVSLDAGLNWVMTDRHQLRVKMQAIALDARMQDAWRFDRQGQALVAPDPVNDFSVRNLGFQIRYRYELAPLSYLYVVYARGGYEQRTGTDGVQDLLQDSVRLRDDEQLVVKLSYRFEI
ncbi:hypothetical protein J2X02_000564 [Pseudoxanthomonas japonensis]|uniref:DUF5916 domain-containing protein n=1 Tax=Pseudoxanthomonas japonensis TaxID=69284 RepID=UPI002861864C|nr:DUF5916 domain-containing protein [Pseudoxanthomonas japonensis]MDR7067747.1 hypothetical protein [Pseudoxanthomonas japonensis]